LSPPRTFRLLAAKSGRPANTAEPKIARKGGTCRNGQDSFDRHVVEQLNVTDGRRKRRIDDQVIADRRIESFGRGREDRPDGPDRKRR
jgi:hypothetical protein